MSETKNAFERAPQGKKMLTLIGIYISLIFAMIQSNGASIVFPAAGAEFDAMSIYSLASSLGGPVSVILMPLWGYIAARSPHLKTSLMAISILIGGASLILRAFAVNYWMVIASGILYCFTTPGIFVIGFTLIRDIFPAQKAGIYLGLVGTMVGIGSIVGPTLTGAVLGAFGWRAATHMIWPFLVIGGIICLLGVKITKAEGVELANKSGSIDVLGIILLALFLGPLILGLSLGSGMIPYGSVPSIVLFVVAVIALIALIFVIRSKQGAAIIPSTAFSDGNTVKLFLAYFFTSFANMLVFFFLPTYIMLVLQPTDLGLTPALWSGIVMASFAIANLFLAPIYGRMIGKSGNARTVATLNIVFRIIVLVLFLIFLKPDTNIWILVAICLIPGGVYNATQTVAYTAGVNIMAPPKLRMQANALVQMGQTLGSSPGVAVGGAIIAMLGIAEGMPIAFIVSAVVCVIAFFPSLMLKKRQEEEE